MKTPFHETEIKLGKEKEEENDPYMPDNSVLRLIYPVNINLKNEKKGTIISKGEIKDIFSLLHVYVVNFQAWKS